ncbi:MAG TPA: hypothetical protein VFR14_00715 [Candidatus Limnocylindrales bacterium]|nr:hypothetical protein [Candidatus Limnocylindrales bacterium]
MNRFAISAALGRRVLTVGGVILSLALGVATIRAAAAWTASAAPLNAAPPSAAELRAALELEQARSEALAAQLAELASGSAELEAALAAAEQQITLDAANADTLRASLATARERLAQLEASLRAAASTSTASVQAPADGTLRSGDEHEEEDREEDEHEEPDDD